MQSKMTRERESMRVTPLGFCLRVIVNEKHLNNKKTTSSVLSVLLLIYAPTFYIHSQGRGLNPSPTMYSRYTNFPY